jgi:hypothetical protein
MMRGINSFDGWAKAVTARRLEWQAAVARLKSAKQRRLTLMWQWNPMLLRVEFVPGFPRCSARTLNSCYATPNCEGSVRQLAESEAMQKSAALGLNYELQSVRDELSQQLARMSELKSTNNSNMQVPDAILKRKVCSYACSDGSNRKRTVC